MIPVQSVLDMQHVAEQEWQHWLAAHEVVEQDGHGVKVLRCADGQYIKIFRIKHRISMARLRNPAKQFCGNAARLRALDIRTVEPLALYRIPSQQRFAVRYAPLQGHTLRQLLREFSLPESCLARLGGFIAHLHDKGVYFRSLHLGNVVLCPDGELGLIDVLDCRFRWFGRPLSAGQRLRNFRHLFRYEEARSIESAVMVAYHAAALQQPLR